MARGLCTPLKGDAEVRDGSSFISKLALDLSRAFICLFVLLVPNLTGTLGYPLLSPGACPRATAPPIASGGAGWAAAGLWAAAGAPALSLRAPSVASSGLPGGVSIAPASPGAHTLMCSHNGHGAVCYPHLSRHSNHSLRRCQGSSCTKTALLNVFLCNANVSLLQLYLSPAQASNQFLWIRVPQNPGDPGRGCV